MISCKEATKFISQKEEGRLSFRQRFQLWQHLAVCAMCRLFNKQNNLFTTNAPHTHEYVDITLSEIEKKAIVHALESGV